MEKKNNLFTLALFAFLVGNSLQAVPEHRNLNLLPLENCGIVQPSDRLIGGKTSNLFEFPWMALLSYSNGQKNVGFKCGGSLINDKYILTAAQCVSEILKLKVTSVRLGEYDLSKDIDCESVSKDSKICAAPVQDFTIEEIIPHPQYNKLSNTNDIALLRINGKATFSDSVAPICLPFTSSVQNSNLERAVVTSWGRTPNKAQSDILKKEALPIIASQECQNLYNKYKAGVTISDKQMCAGGNERSGPCGGDGGSPLQAPILNGYKLNYVQYGIVSFGPSPCGTNGIPDVFTKVSEYKDWILDNIKP